MMKKRKPRILLIDDDPSFTSVMAHVAMKNGLIAHSYNDIDEVEPRALEDADVVVLDYDLGHTTGLAIGRWLERLRFKKPVLLVSADHRAFGDAVGWPSTIRNFATKSLGPFGVLQSIRALAAS
jgi:DNA-binding response OmpR family regulator